MYVNDDLKRINEIAFLECNGDHICDTCNEVAVIHTPIKNPADFTRDIERFYCVSHLCDECYENGHLYEDTFHCSECSELFITHHSWDSLTCVIDGQFYCHKCALDEVQPITLREAINNLQDGKTDNFLRISGYPGKESLGVFEFSQRSDFPGYTSFVNLSDGIVASASEKGYPLDVMVYPFIVHTFQLSVSLEIFID